MCPLPFSRPNSGSPMRSAMPVETDGHPGSNGTCSPRSLGSRNASAPRPPRTRTGRSDRLLLLACCQGHSVGGSRVARHRSRRSPDLGCSFKRPVPPDLLPSTSLDYTSNAANAFCCARGRSSQRGVGDESNPRRPAAACAARGHAKAQVTIEGETLLLGAPSWCWPRKPDRPRGPIPPDHSSIASSQADHSLPVPTTRRLKLRPQPPGYRAAHRPRLRGRPQVPRLASGPRRGSSRLRAGPGASDRSTARVLGHPPARARAAPAAKARALLNGARFRPPRDGLMRPGPRPRSPGPEADSTARSRIGGRGRGYPTRTGRGVDPPLALPNSSWPRVTCCGRGVVSLPTRGLWVGSSSSAGSFRVPSLFPTSIYRGANVELAGGSLPSTARRRGHHRPPVHAAPGVPTRGARCA